jgi:alkyldihydroxyacetonephosphate synthase
MSNQEPLFAPALRHAFEATSYTTDHCEVRIGQTSKGLDQLLSAAATTCAAFLTAFNPGARRTAPETNDLNDKALLQTLKATVKDPAWLIATRHVPDDQSAQAFIERGWLVLGLQPADAVEIANNFGQLAVVCAFFGRPAILVEVPQTPPVPWRAGVDRSDLSHWAWGRAGGAESRQDAAAMATMVASLLGCPERTLNSHVPCNVADARVPAPRLRANGVPECIHFDDATRARHTYGRSWPDQYRAAQGDFTAAPDAVAMPDSTLELQQVMDWAGSVDADIVPFGGGTNVVHAFQPLSDKQRRPRLVISTRGLRGLLSLDATNLLATFGGGTTGPEVNRSLAPFGLQLRHYPQSWEFSTVGGWVATRAGGHFATRYTHIDDLLVSANSIAPAGEIRTLAVPSSGAGPEPMRALTGSEGGLGIITEATLRVHRRPRFKAGFNAFFTNYDIALDACRRVLQSGLTPSSCRILDPREAMLNQVDGSGRAILLLGFESDSDVGLDATAEACKRMLMDLADEIVPVARTTRGDADAIWRNAFLEAPYLQPALACQGVMVDTLETAASYEQLPSLRRELIRTISAAALEQGCPALVSSRMTHAYHDGASLYLTWLTLTASRNPTAQWSHIKGAATETIVRAGGPITHHHSVGSQHLDGWRRQTSPDWVRGWMAMRNSLDPDGRMVPWLLCDRD